jgi:hypothetical protein
LHVVIVLDHDLWFGGKVPEPILQPLHGGVLSLQSLRERDLLI